jgi:acetyl coenzyme A synthetase (ADP forming)-like protein
VRSSLERILAPRSVAVIGVSSRPDSLSGRLFANLKAAGFPGGIYPINPKAATIAGLACYPAIAAAPGPVDLAVIMVPRDAVLAAVDECIAAAVGGVVVITAGFREGGESGAAVERELLARLRAAGVRMIGPNCMGLINLAPDVRLDATFSPTPAAPGRVAFASHSGALGVAVLEAARELGLGFAQFVSLGNSADVTACDLLEQWELDDRVGVVLLYLESLDEPRRFLDVAARVAARKPVVVLKSGRTEAGARAASSHTGALAAADTAVAAVLKQAGAVRVDTLAEMLDVVRAFERCPLPAGPRVAVVTNAGGPAIAATDALGGHGLALAGLSEGTRAALRSFLPPEAPVGNPVDMLPSATPEHYARAVELAAADPGVDALVVITVRPPLLPPLAVARAVAAVAPAAGKPVMSVFMTVGEFYGEASALPGMPPIYRFPESAVRALGALHRYAQRPVRPLPAAVPPARSAALAAARPGPDGYLAPADAFAVLEEIGVPVAPWRVVATADELAPAAAAVGFPVVLKAVGERLVHKSEMGAVAVGLRDAGELAAAAAAMRARLAAHGVEPGGFLVQRQVAGGREAIAGIVCDPATGPLVMCGLGGVAVEVWKDVSFRVAPVDRAEAEAMVDSLRGAPLLGAFRGRRPADRAALAAAIERLGALAAAHPELAECDINPLLVLDDGAGCVAVDARLRVGA